MNAISDEDMEIVFHMTTEELQEAYNNIVSEVEDIEEWLQTQVLGATVQEIEEQLEDLDECRIWRTVYEERLADLQGIIRTPPLKPKTMQCEGCLHNELNQLGHMGGCMPSLEEFEIYLP